MVAAVDYCSALLFSMAADKAVTRSPERSRTTRSGDDVEHEEDREAKKMKTNLATEEAAADDRVEKLLPTRHYFEKPLLAMPDSAKKAVLSAARSLIGLSSFRGGEPLARSAGVWINWDEGSRKGVVLTTAHLIRAKKPLVKSHRRCKDQYLYHRDAQVIVHLLDETTAEGRLLYHQEHYDIAFFMVAMDQRVQLASFADTVNNGQVTLLLAREENLDLKITHGKVKRKAGHHFLYFSQDNEYEDDGCGGPVIDFDGKVVGMFNGCRRGPFVPSSVLNGCMDLWRNFGCILRPHLGLQFEAIKFLDPTRGEYIWRKLNIDDGLVVEEMSAGSHAEKIGIRVGDIIDCINGERISTTLELENKLLSICMCNFNRGNLEVDVSIRVFHTAKRLRRTINLTVNVSDRKEVIEQAYYPVTNGEGFSAAMSPEQVDSDSNSDSE
ncbi:serine protease Do-like HtrA [Triticum dicoccoides]|uniref:serine protease Do-like HtrA n=1 Tax=Triticum dicoccoides TaxID=85692 RepID=UPI00188DC9F8|nr:serine protease Do-like HtrA [Triticum dicoccoides]